MHHLRSVKDVRPVFRKGKRYPMPNFMSLKKTKQNQQAQQAQQAQQSKAATTNKS
jgi:hypothetical protein